MLAWFEETGKKEGLTTWAPSFLPLEIFNEQPELRPGSSDLFYDIAAKIFLGQVADPEAAWDEYVAEYMRRSGDKVIKQATLLYEEGKACRIE